MTRHVPMQGRMKMMTKYRATGVRYNTRTRRVDVELSNGMALSVPARHIEGLEGATTAQLKQARIRGRGTAGTNSTRT